MTAIQINKSPRAVKSAKSLRRRATKTQAWCLCLLFVAINLIEICINVVSAEHHHHHHHEEPKHKFHPYKYGYKVIDHKGNKQWKQEESHTPHEVKGSYGYKDKHGLFREVHYVADKHGFRAKIKTNELHGKVKNPANVEIISEPSYSGHGHGAASQVHTVQAATPLRQPARLPIPTAASAMIAAAPVPAAPAPASTVAVAPEDPEDEQ